MEDSLITKNTVKNLIEKKLEKIQSTGDGKKHVCMYCGQKFIKKEFLRSHLQIRHNSVEEVNVNPQGINSVNLSSNKGSFTKEWDIPEVGGGLIDDLQNLDFSGLSMKDIERIDVALDELQKIISKSMESLKESCEFLMIELKYMICEYKSPFIALSR